MHKFFSSAAIAVVVSAAIVGSVEATTIRIQTSSNSGDFTFNYVNENWVPKLELMSGGDLKVIWLPINAVVPAKESLDAMAVGVLDGVYNFVGRFAGKDPAYAIMADLVAAYDNPDQ